MDGQPRNVSVTVAGSNLSLSVGGYANLTNTGDYARLLNDAAAVDDIWKSWTFHGLTNGTYRVVTYAIKPYPEYTQAFISVNGGAIATTSGVMPGNQFILGVTHVSQETVVTDGSLTIRVA